MIPRFILPLFFFLNVSLNVFALDTVFVNNAKPQNLSLVTNDTSELIIKSIQIKASDAKHQNESDYSAMFGDTIIMTIQNLNKLKYSRTNENPIILTINKIPFPEIKGHLAGTSHNQIKFFLTRLDGNDQDWDKIFRTGFLKKTLYLGASLNDRSLFTRISLPISFVLRTPGQTIPFIILCLFILILTIYLVWKKGLLLVNHEGSKSYSLSAVHLFFWTTVILASYMLIWFICDDMNSIVGSSLVLLGISAGTASAGSIIDNSGKNNLTARSQGNSSPSFWRDMLYENNEISIHRYQMLMFNLVVGVFFIYKTASDLKMPELNEALLTMLGISSATYASLKAIMNKSGKPAETKTEEEKKD